MATLKTIVLRKCEGTLAQLCEVERTLNSILSSITFGKETIPDIDHAEVYQRIASANTDIQKAKGKLEVVMQELSSKKKGAAV
jgi:hypothetical protein